MEKKMNWEKFIYTQTNFINTQIMCTIVDERDKNVTILPLIFLCVSYTQNQSSFFVILYSSFFFFFEELFLLYLKKYFFCQDNTVNIKNKMNWLWLLDTKRDKQTKKSFKIKVNILLKCLCHKSCINKCLLFFYNVWSVVDDRLILLIK